MARTHSRRARHIRGSLAFRIGGTVLVIVTAGVVTSVLLLHHPGVRARQDANRALSARVSSALTVGLINPGPTTAQHPAAVRRMLNVTGHTLNFTTATNRATAAGLEQWTADHMADGSYIFVFVPTGQCLAGSAAHPDAVSLTTCDLSAAQRWQHLHTGFVGNGRYYWELRNMVTGRCLANPAVPVSGHPGESAARLQPCQQGSHPPGQLIRLLTAY
jgi:Ricin-type beta-trefoil lectin domain-like